MADETPVNEWFAEERRTTTHPTGGRRITLAGVTFDARLPYELVLSIDDANSIFSKYGVDEERAVALMGNELFKRALKTAEAELKEAGLTFRTKARLMAEDLLEEGYSIATDPEAPANVRASLIQWVAKMGDLEPAKKDTAVSQGGFHLHIDLGGGESDRGRSITVSANAPAPDADILDLVPGVDGVLAPMGGKDDGQLGAEED
jgi:hypothetical protein